MIFINGSFIYLVSNLLIQKIKNEVTTCNFEVEDFHTYYVGEKHILVHNACSGEAATKTANYSDEFLEWLNKGDNNNSVYNCFDDAMKWTKAFIGG